MSKLVRRKLGTEAQQYLDDKTREVSAAPPGDCAALARRLWRDARKTAALKIIKKKLRRMATGLRRCMYREDSAGVAIDHFWPLARFPDRAFRWKNYLYACIWCNSNKKRDQFPISSITGKPLLIKPTMDDPMDHLALDPGTGIFTARTPKGDMSIQVFGLNERSELPDGRRNALLALQVLICKYAELHAAGNVAVATEIKRVVREYPFSSVLSHILRLAGGAGAILLQPELLSALQARPELQTWV